jgi:hypothetical protein
MSLLDRVIAVAGSPIPIRTRLVRKFLTRYPIGSFIARLHAGGFERPWYAWCLYYAAQEAKALGYNAFTAIELGVAGGSGLLTLCNYRDEVEREVGIKIILVGLDAGTGLPETNDPRDLLYWWPAGSFAMDIPKLKARLNGRAEVVFGDVSVTARELPISPEAPLGAIFFDLDFYTSTRDAFALFSQKNLLPRIWCYFDDVAGMPGNAYTDSIGVRQAIKEFNAAQPPLGSHISPAYAFTKYPVPEAWHDKIYLYHDLAHPHYNRCLSDHKHTLSIE